MRLSDQERIRLQVCSAIITRNRRELEWAVAQPHAIVGQDLLHEAQEALKEAPVPGQHGLVRLTSYLPAAVQYVGQRAILLFPTLSRRLLRSSGIHHQMF